MAASSRKISRSSSLRRSGTEVTSGRIGVGNSASGATPGGGAAGPTCKERVPACPRTGSGIDTAYAWSMAGAPTLALGSRPTRNNISRKSSTRSRQASQRRRWSRAHSRSFPSRRSSSTALGEIRVQRLRSKLDVVIDLPQLRATPVQRMHQLTRLHVDDIGELVVRELDEIAEQNHHAGFERQGGDGPLHRIATQCSARLGLRKSF